MDLVGPIQDSRFKIQDSRFKIHSRFKIQEEPLKGDRVARRLLAYLVLIPLAWWLMCIVHEAGHVVAAWATGGEVERIVLAPWRFSRTDLSRNPHPAVVAWSGVLFGAVAPALAWAASAGRFSRIAGLGAFFAGFCLIANGAYLASGLFYPVGDAQDLIRLGVPRWVLAMVGTPMLAFGLLIWHMPGFFILKRPAVRS